MTFFSEDKAAELRQVFFDSAQELLQTLNDEALKLEKNPADPETAQSIRRTVHTLKGDSAACGFRELSELAHELEDALVPEVAKSMPAQVAELVLSAADVFEAMLAAYRNKLQLPQAEPLRQMVRRLRSSDAPQHKTLAASAPHAQAWSEYEQLAITQAVERGKQVFRVRVQIDPQCPMRSAARQLIQNVLQKASHILAIHPGADAKEEVEFIEAAIASDQQAQWIAGRCRIPAITTDVSVSPWMAAPTTHDEAAQLSHDTTSTSPATGPQRVENSLRVDAERIDQVLNLIGELIIGKSMLQQTLNEFSRRFPKDALRNRFADAMAYQTRVLNDLQRSAMQVRMVPVEQLFRRFPRLVRDVCKQCGKDVGLVLMGQDTELDKTILDALAEPLAHLVRNAVDHGIESPELRATTGKDAKGTVRMNAYHQGNQVVIEVADDGGGIDSEQVLRTALERGVVAADEAGRLSQDEIAQLIFKPGFSTAEQVTEISGRGIGLDVVQTVLHRLKGSVTVESTPGAGTRFQLKVPLTLAIIKALLFRVDARLYAIPLNSVVEIARASEHEIHRVDCDEVLQLRKAVLTLVRLGKRADSGDKMFVVVAAMGDHKYGLIVDNLVGEEELVIKPLDDQVVATNLVSGASILGDGTVVLVLNLAAIVERYGKLRPADGANSFAGLLSNSSSSTASATGGAS